MPVPKRSSSQFIADLRAGIVAQDPSYDEGVGPIPDVMVLPYGPVLEDMNERTRRVSLVMSASNEAEFDDVTFEADLDDLLENEGKGRIQGGRSTVVAKFRRSTAPLADAVVPRGYPVGTQPDATSGQAVVFVAAETRTMPAATAESYKDPVSGKYVLEVPMVAQVPGSSGRVPKDRVTRRLRPLVGFDDVTNEAASGGGRDRETNREAIARFRLAVIGQQLAVPFGLQRVTKDEYPNVSDQLSVYGLDPLLTRAGTDAGAVDAYVKGDQLLSTADVITFLGVGQLLAVLSPPLRSVVSVTAGATTFIEGDDYAVVKDATGYAGSTRAADGVSFLVGGSSGTPAVGTAVTVTYTYNELVRVLQSDAAGATRYVFGEDLLYKEGVAVPIRLEALLRVGTGLGTTTVKAAVEAALLKFVNTTTGLGARRTDDPTQRPGALELFDLDTIVGSVSGADDFTVTVLRRSTVPAGAVVDLPIARNEYPTLADVDLVITPA